MEKYIIGSRGSKLALAQAEWVKKNLQERFSGCEFVIKKITTTGDKMKDSPLSSLGVKGLFTKEIEEALLNKNIDIAVHSMKDLPTELPAGLAIAGISNREDPHDALISKDKLTLVGLPQGALIGTSSLRRKAQLLAYRPDLKIVNLRGNLTTRLSKLKDEELRLSAIVVAFAGLKRLGMESELSEILDYSISLPAVGQGSLGIEIREDNMKAKKLAECIDHEPSRLAVSAERAFLKGLGGGCQVPIGAIGEIKDERLKLKGIVISEDGKDAIKGEISGDKFKPEEIGRKLAEDLLSRGAKGLLAV
jgi:hydroxymethylbilane synthase